MGAKLTAIDAQRKPPGFATFGISDSGAPSHISIEHYWRAIGRQKWLILMLVLLGAIGGSIKALHETPSYRAMLTMIIEPELPNLAQIEGALVMAYTMPQFFETQYALIRSRSVAERVVENLNLVDRKPLYEPPARRVFAATRVLGESINIVREWLQIGSESDSVTNQEVQSPAERQRRHSELTSMIREKITVKPERGSQIVTVSFESPDPRFSAEIANAIVDAYIALGLEARLTRAGRANTWLTGRLQELREKLTESETALRAFQAQEEMIDLQSMEQLSGARLEILNKALVQAQSNFNDLSKRYGPKHPKNIAARAELAQAQRRLANESQGILASRGKQLELASLEREVNANRELYDLFLTRFKETDLSTDKDLGNARVVDPARIPNSPYRPDEMRIIGIWSFFGLVIGVLGAIVREQLDNTFKTPEQVEELTQLPVLGLMPLLNEKKLARTNRGAETDGVPERHFVNFPKSPFSESINHIRTGILYSNIDNPPVTILVSSSLQEEGKTTLATNLALSFGQLDRTLLIDADLRKPRVAQVTGVGPSLGLVEFVAGRAAFKDCIVTDSNCENLSILRSGVLPPNPLELLSSKRAENALQQLRRHYARIIIDTAPILPVSDAIVLGHVVDALVLIIQADRTGRSTVFDMLRRLRGANIKPLGTVLSKVNRRKSPYYYDRYQYYASYYSEPQSQLASQSKS